MFETDVQSAGDFGQRHCLGVPVNLHLGKMGLLEHHRRVRLENLVDVARIVLASDGEDHAACVQVKQAVLKFNKRTARIGGA